MNKHFLQILNVKLYLLVELTMIADMIGTPIMQISENLRKSFDCSYPRSLPDKLAIKFKLVVQSLPDQKF